MNKTYASLQIAQSTGGHHLTEDAGWGGIYEASAVLAVADGAPIRLRPIKSLQPLLDHFAPRYTAEVTPSGVAARLIRDTAVELAAHFPPVPLEEMVVRANQRLADHLCTIYGDLSAAAVATAEPHLTILHEDERTLRLALPAATYALARVDWDAKMIEIVQGADAAVFLIYTDGSTEQVTPDQMAQHDNAAKRLWLAQPETPARHPFFRAWGDNLGQELNRTNGLYHNYVAENGALDHAVGVSVVDGLPEMKQYMFKTTRPLENVRAVLVTSDGMFWPAPLNETEVAARERINRMGQRIMRDGLNGYLSALRAEEVRLRESGINPYQFHDDATGLLLTLE